MSEVHPRTDAYLYLLDPIGQALDWFGFFTDMADPRAYFAELSFADKIQAIYDEVAKRGGTLILRDWTHLDFTAFPHVEDPTYRFSIYDSLADRFDIRAAALVRHPMTQYRSHRALLIDGASAEQATFVDQNFTPERYADVHLRFATEASKITFHRYRDFVANPDLFLYKLCTALEMRFDATYALHWRDNYKLTGAVEERTDEIGMAEHEPLPDDLRARLANSPSYKKTLDLLGYI